MSVASARAVLAGLAAFVTLVLLGDAIAGLFLLPPAVGDAPPQAGPLYLSASLGIAFAGGVIGGFACAALAKARRFAHAAVLAGVVALGCGVWGAIGSSERSFLVIGLPLLACVGVVAGGGLRVVGGR